MLQVLESVSDDPAGPAAKRPDQSWATARRGSALAGDPARDARDIGRALNSQGDNVNLGGSREDPSTRADPLPSLHESAPALRMLIADIGRRLRGGIVLLLGLSVVNGLLEGIGVLLLLPLLATIGIGGGESRLPLLGDIGQRLTAIGIEANTVSILVLIVVVFLIQYLVFLSYSHMVANLQYRYEALWRQDLFSSCMTSGWAFFTRFKSGELINTFLGETTRLGSAFQMLAYVSSALIVTCAYVGLAAATSWRTTLYLLLVGTVLFLATRRLVKRGRRIGTGISRGTHALQFHANEIVGGAKLIKATSTEQVAERRFANIVQSLRKLYYWNLFNQSLLRCIFEFGAIIALCVILAVGVKNLGIDPARILVVLALFLRLYPRLSNIQQQLQALNVNLPAIETTTAVRSSARAASEPIDERPLPDGFGDGPVALDIRDLHVAYDERTVLDGVSLSLRPGATTAIVGPSGSGKSTLVDCILGLTQPRSGSITCNGINLEQLPLRAWRRSVGYVAQDTFLFHASVRDNIMWGQESDDPDRLTAAAERAYAHKFIARMAGGYDSVVGDRGVRLSGGERQRLGLARALIGQPSLLILDEATSALDSESEETVLSAIRELDDDVTIVTIAHRLSSVRDADNICVLEAGRVVETGKQEDLLARGGRFAELWALQNRGE